MALLDAWADWVDAGARELLERGDLENIVIEFYKPGSGDASGRRDFPIRYDGILRSIQCPIRCFDKSLGRQLSHH